jgi:hypothetical protein
MTDYSIKLAVHWNLSNDFLAESLSTDCCA